MGSSIGGRLSRARQVMVKLSGRLVVMKVGVRGGAQRGKESLEAEAVEAAS